MRVSKLIERLRLLQSLHGDVHITSYDSRGDRGTPRVRDIVEWKSGNKRSHTRWEITTEETR